MKVFFPSLDASLLPSNVNTMWIVVVMYCLGHKDMCVDSTDANYFPNISEPWWIGSMEVDSIDMKECHTQDTIAHIYTHRERYLERWIIKQTQRSGNWILAYLTSLLWVTPLLLPWSFPAGFRVFFNDLYMFLHIAKQHTVYFCLLLISI